MKPLMWFFVLILSVPLHAKEWSSLTVYQKQTGRTELVSSDWLTSDRKKDTRVWHNANVYNLENQLPEEYQSIAERRDFYEWYYKRMETKGHQVVWPKMAHYIARKLRLTKVFPFNIFTKKTVKEYANQGNELVFNSVFKELKTAHNTLKALQGDSALDWDKDILFLEQYRWLQEIYSDIDDNALKTIKRMSQGKGFYALMVPKDIRFKGDISDPKTRYEYALGTLRGYCREHYK